MRGRIALLAIVLLVLAGAVVLWMQGDPTYRYDPDKAIYLKFSGDRAFAYVEKLVEFGPRPAGSDALEASRQYIETTLGGLGWVTQRQSFNKQTIEGEITFVNLRARLAGESVWEQPCTLLIGSHIDTKLYRDFSFVGANDSGSSTGALLEIARVLATNPALAKSVELVFFDGEEAFKTNIDSFDGLYGSRHYAQQARKWPAERRPQYGIILDLIGDKDLNIGVPSDSPLKLYRWLTSAARDLNYASYFGKHSSPILDDHVPLNEIGIPTIDVIDLDYDVWHTAGDTMDKISAESLHIVGKTVLLMIEKYMLGQSSR